MDAARSGFSFNSFVEAQRKHGQAIILFREKFPWETIYSSRKPVDKHFIFLFKYFLILFNVWLVNTNKHSKFESRWTLKYICAQCIIILPVSKFKGDIENGCKLIRNRSDCKDIDWTTYTCVLGFQVFGKNMIHDKKTLLGFHMSYIYLLKSINEKYLMLSLLCQIQKNQIELRLRSNQTKIEPIWGWFPAEPSVTGTQ